MRQVRAVDPETREPQQSEGGKLSPPIIRLRGPLRGRNRLAKRGPEDDPSREGEEGEPGTQCAVAEDPLEEVGQEQEGVPSNAKPTNKDERKAPPRFFSRITLSGSSG